MFCTMTGNCSHWSKPWEVKSQNGFGCHTNTKIKRQIWQRTVTYHKIFKSNCCFENVTVIWMRLLQEKKKKKKRESVNIILQFMKILKAIHDLSSLPLPPHVAQVPAGGWDTCRASWRVCSGWWSGSEYQEHWHPDSPWTCPTPHWKTVFLFIYLNLIYLPFLENYDQHICGINVENSLPLYLNIWTIY